MQRCARPGPSSMLYDMRWQCSALTCSGDAQNSLHLTVKAEWPTLEKQFRTTTQLSRRIDAVQSDVTDVEDKLDGSVSFVDARRDCRVLS